MEDREFNWKARITGDEDEDNEESSKMKEKDAEHNKEPKYSSGDIARYMRDGILPR